MERFIAALFVLLGVASFQANAGNLYDLATTCTWTLARADGTVLSTTLKLSPTGEVAGHENSNERFWGIEDGVLFFRHEDGRVSTRFTSAAVNAETGQVGLQGSYLFVPEIIHILACHQ